MRTTIEISEEQRAELLKLAAQRGEKGFSALIQEALGDYLKAQAARQDTLDAALSLRGTLGAKAGEELEQRVRATRENWR